MAADVRAQLIQIRDLASDALAILGNGPTEPGPTEPLPFITDNQATAYNITIESALVVPKWFIAQVRKVPGDGKHNVYVYAFDERGIRVSDKRIRIGWTWDGRQPNQIADPKPLDKPIGEPHGNIDVYWAQTLTVWLDGDGLPSDRAHGFHVRWPADSMGYPGHHCFEITFNRVVPF